MVQLSDELVDQLDEEAARLGRSRSALIRDLLTEALARSSDRPIGAAIADGYRRVPQATPDEWGDLVGAGDASTREMLQRLDAEEAAAGFDPW